MGEIDLGGPKRGKAPGVPPPGLALIPLGAQVADVVRRLPTLSEEDFILPRGAPYGQPIPYPIVTTTLLGPKTQARLASLSYSNQVMQPCLLAPRRALCKQLAGCGHD